MLMVKDIIIFVQGFHSQFHATLKFHVKEFIHTRDSKSKYIYAVI